MEDHVCVCLPEWTGSVLERAPRTFSDEEAMRFVIDLARRNVEEGTGGPFGAAVFQFEVSGKRLVSIGLNRVEPMANSCAHAEVVAIMLAEKTVRSFSLGSGTRRFELYTSCDPCAMCLGATLWSGVTKLVCGASRSDAESIGFEEGPVTEASYEYLAAKGIEIVRGVLREEAASVLREYAQRCGTIYNGRSPGPERAI